MLLDWVTFRVDMESFPREQWEQMRALMDRIVRFCPKTSEIIWETAAWESVRSDSHQIAFRVGSDAVWVQGSPARVCGKGDAVFGEGAARAMDLGECVKRMAGFVSKVMDLTFPEIGPGWHVSRVDVTGNLELDNLAAVRVALRILRDCEGGRYRVSQQAGDTVYWSHRSRLRSGKAYAKGAHLRYATGKADYSGRPYTAQEILEADRLLRLELRLGAQWWRERVGKHWSAVTAEDLQAEWQSYFDRMLGSAEMSTGMSVQEKIMGAADTEGRGRAAFGCWSLIQAVGWERARESFAKPTWYRHLQVLHRAGLGDADLSAGKVVELRRRVLECRRVDSWSELRRAA